MVKKKRTVMMMTISYTTTRFTSYRRFHKLPHMSQATVQHQARMTSTAHATSYRTTQVTNDKHPT